MSSDPATDSDGESFYLMPSLGADMVEGTVVHWLVKPGDMVHRGDMVATIDTDKADIDAEIFQDGQIAEFLVPIGERVPVGTPLARLLPVGAAIVGGPSQQSVPERSGRSRPNSRTSRGTCRRSVVGEFHSPDDLPRPATDAPVFTEPSQGVGHPLTYSPMVRKIATESGLDLTHVSAHGPGHRVTRDDVEEALLTRQRVAHDANTEHRQRPVISPRPVGCR